MKHAHPVRGRAGINLVLVVRSKRAPGPTNTARPLAFWSAHLVAVNMHRSHLLVAENMQRGHARCVSGYAGERRPGHAKHDDGRKDCSPAVTPVSADPATPVSADPATSSMIDAHDSSKAARGRRPPLARRCQPSWRFNGHKRFISHLGGLAVLPERHYSVLLLSL